MSSQPTPSDVHEQHVNALLEQANQLGEAGQYRRAIYYATRAVDRAREHLGENHWLTDMSLVVLATWHAKTGDHQTSGRLYEQAIAIRRTMLGDEHLDIAQSLDTLAKVYMKVRDYDRSMAAASEALAIRKKLQGENHLDYAKTLDTQAWLYMWKGQPGEAKRLWEQILAIRRAALGNNHSDVAYALKFLAAANESIGDFAQARLLYEEALPIFLSLGEEHSGVVATKEDLARVSEKLAQDTTARSGVREAPGSSQPATPDVMAQEIRKLIQQIDLLHKSGQYERALDTATRAVELARKHLGENHLYFNESAFRLANLYFLTGNYQGALPLFERELVIQRAKLGDEHLEVAVSLHNLASTYQAMGEYEKAMPLVSEALAIRKKLLGENHLDYANTLDTQAWLFMSTGKYDAARPLREQILAIRRAALGNQHPAVGEALESLALLLEAIGDFVRARELFEEALAIALKSGDENLSVTSIRNSLVRVAQREVDDLSVQVMRLYEQGRYEQAKRIATQARDLAHEHLGPEHPAYAQTLNNLGMMYHVLGDLRHALPLLCQALAITGKALGEEHADYARSLSNLGSVYQAMGEYAEALPLLSRAVAIASATVGEENADYARFLNNLGRLYHLMGEYAQAVPLERRALAILRSAVREDDADVATNLSNLGLLHQEMGDFPEARLFLSEALAIRRKVLGGNHPDIAGILNNLGEWHRTLGDYPQAELHYKLALAIWQKSEGFDQHPDTATCLSNLGLVYQAVGQYAEAESRFQESVDLRRKILGENHVEYAWSLSNLGGLYGTLGEYTKALPLMRQALAILREAVGENHPDVAMMLYNIADVSMAEGRVTEAIGLMEQAARINDETIEHIFSIGSERQRLTTLIHFKDTLDASLSVVVNDLSRTPAAVQQGMDLVLRRKGIGTEALAAQRDAVLGGHYPALQPKLAQLTALRQRIARKALSGPGSEDLQLHRQRLRELTAEREVLESELAQLLPETGLVQHLRSSNREAIAGALPKGSVLVEFVRMGIFNFTAVPARGEPRWNPARYVAFILPAREPDNVHLIDLGEAAAIDRLLATFRAALTGESGTGIDRHLVPASPKSARSDDMDVATALREAIFDPLATALGSRQRLIIAPDGDLTRLPFEVLPTPDGRRLIDAYQISYLGVGRDVLRFEAKSTNPPALPVVAADPEFDLRAAPESAGREGPTLDGRLLRDLDLGDLRFARLRGTRVEGERIGALLGVQPLVEGAVLESRLKANRSPRILHLATHGFFLADQPQHLANQQLGRSEAGATGSEEVGRLSDPMLRSHPLLLSGLALAGANTWLEGNALPDEAEDGLLTAEDVTALDLLDTELVVLSACETGLGTVEVGEGVYGLRRSFTVAGAKTLVMSLWNVPDEQTQELMVDFYNRLLAGQGRADALRSAQLALKAKEPDPYYWGAFVCQGDPGPLAKAT